MLRTVTVTIEAEGRDQGGVFVLTEKPALQASEWFIRAMMLLSRSGAEIPVNLLQQGPTGFVTLGLGAVLTGAGKAPWVEVKTLLDELRDCVTSYQPPGAVAPITSRAIMFGQVQEPITFIRLHEEVLSLHLGFSLAAKLLSLRAFAAAMMTDEPGPNTPTSTEPAES